MTIEIKPGFKPSKVLYTCWIDSESDDTQKGWFMIEKDSRLHLMVPNKVTQIYAGQWIIPKVDIKQCMSGNCVKVTPHFWSSTGDPSTPPDPRATAYVYKNWKENGNIKNEIIAQNTTDRNSGYNFSSFIIDIPGDEEIVDDVRQL